MTSDGSPYGPYRYREIAKERYYIAKQGNITYQDTGKVTPTERRMLLEFILDDLKTQQRLINQQLAKR